MHIIIGTSDLPLIRSRLHDHLRVKPSLLAEAFAAGLGHSNNAAALASLTAREKGNSNSLDSLPFDLHVFSARLASLGVRNELVDGQSASNVMDSVLRRSGVVDEGLSFEERYDDALGKMGKRLRSPVDEFTKSGMREVEKFCAIAGILDWRMNKTGWLLDWFREWGQPFGLQLHRRLAAACDRHADLDPDMAAFLSDAMEALDGVELVRQGDSPRGCLAGEQLPDEDNDELSERAFAPLKAADGIYSTFNARIVRFFDKVCRRWDVADNILVMEPAWPSLPRGRAPVRSSVRSGPRYAGITVGLTGHAKKCKFIMSDTGQGEVDAVSARGLVAFALWRSGVPATEVSEFGIEADDAYVNVVDVIRRWVNLDGNAHAAGTGASRKALMRLCHPDGMPARPDRMAEHLHLAEEYAEAKARDGALPPPRLVDDDEFRAVLDNPVEMARLFKDKDESLDGMFLDKEGAIAWLMRRRHGGSRKIAVSPSVMASAMTSWLRGCRRSTPSRVGQTEAYVSAGQEGFRVSFQEMLECVHLAIRAIPCVLISDGNEGERAIEPHAAHAIESHADTSEYHPMLPFGEVPKGHELDVLEERSMVVSRVSHPHTVAAVENLVLRGLMTAVVTEDMGYGRRRFDASYMGMRFLARLKRS